MDKRLHPDFISRQVANGRYLFLDLKPAVEDELSVNCVGWEECRADFEVRRESFRYHAVEFIAAGEWELAVAGHVYRLGPGTVFSYRPDTVFQVRAVGGGPLLKYFMDFSGRAAGERLENCGLLGGEPLSVAGGHRLMQLFEQMLECVDNTRAVAGEMCRHLGEMIFLTILEERGAGGDKMGAGKESYLRCRGYIFEHFRRLKKVEEVSEACHLDAAYLSRLFKEHSNEGPYRLLIRLKMNYAAGLLARENVSVKEAAAVVGFGDPYHFSRVFRQSFGIAPSYFAARK